MPAGGSQKGKRRGGRHKGVPNRSTTEMALKAEQDILRAKAMNRPLAKEVLDQFMQLFAGLAAAHQPIPEGTQIPLGRKPNVDLFEKWARLAVQVAKDLAPYQSPTFRAIMVSTPGQNDAPAIKQVEGNVIQLNDHVGAARVYKQIMGAGGRR